MLNTPGSFAGKNVVRTALFCTCGNEWKIRFALVMPLTYNERTLYVCSTRNRVCFTDACDTAMKFIAGTPFKILLLIAVYGFHRLSMKNNDVY
jgi:hypothetical protein